MLLHVISEVIPNMKNTHKVLPTFESQLIPKEGNELAAINFISSHKNDVY
jgi:hypothetical protein